MSVVEATIGLILWGALMALFVMLWLGRYRLIDRLIRSSDGRGGGSAPSISTVDEARDRRGPAAYPRAIEIVAIEPSSPLSPKRLAGLRSAAGAVEKHPTSDRTLFDTWPVDFGLEGQVTDGLAET